MKQQTRQTHLEFYREHQITPVHYDLSNMNAHFDRRQILYTKLGLLPLTFNRAKVLEIAAGTGQNSLYIAQLMPEKLILLEPNQVAVEHIYSSYAGFEKKHTKPQIVDLTLEEYTPHELFDIVLCENWLGTSPHETLLLNKLTNLIASQGLLVLTTVSPIGFVPNLLRRFLSIYLCKNSEDFANNTKILTSAFSSHLKKLTAMTRNTTDWVQDNMLNPAYFGLCLSIPVVLEQLHDRFEVVGSSPAFAEDWRWFKGVHGTEKKINEHFLSAYWQKAHNFLDCREEPILGNAEYNRQLEMKACELLQAIAEHEDAFIEQKNLAAYVKNVLSILDVFIANVPTHFGAALKGLHEVREYIAEPAMITGSAISNMQDFSSLFGRETVYISLMRGQE